jgi:hypothetical protein
MVVGCEQAKVEAVRWGPCSDYPRRLVSEAQRIRLAYLYNEHWLIERLGHRTPAEVRRSLVHQMIPA